MGYRAAHSLQRLSYCVAREAWFLERDLQFARSAPLQPVHAINAKRRYSNEN
jgi:hypothetical protein